MSSPVELGIFTIVFIIYYSTKNIFVNISISTVLKFWKQRKLLLSHKLFCILIDKPKPHIFFRTFPLLTLSLFNAFPASFSKTTESRVK